MLLRIAPATKYLPKRNPPMETKDQNFLKTHSKNLFQAPSMDLKMIKQGIILNLENFGTVNQQPDLIYIVFKADPLNPIVSFETEADFTNTIDCIRQPVNTADMAEGGKCTR